MIENVGAERWKKIFQYFLSLFFMFSIALYIFNLNQNSKNINSSFF